MTRLTFRGASISLHRELIWPLFGLVLAFSAPLCAGQTPGGGDPVTCQAPVLVVPAAKSVNPPPLPPAVSPPDTGRIETDPAQFDVRFADAVAISIRNSTSSEISLLRFNSLGLTDGSSHHSIPSWDWSLTMKVPLKPGERIDCTFHPPTSDYAGTYIGALRIQANGYESTVPITVRTRGPFSSRWTGFPLALLTLTFFAGWALSLFLNQWYTIDLPRVQLVLLLREEGTALSNFLEQLQAWQKKYNTALNTTRTVAKFDGDEIDTLLKNVNSAPLVDLQQAQQRFHLACSLNDELWTALQIAEQSFSKQDLASVATRLDSVPRAPDPTVYRAGLLQVLTAPLPPAGAPAAPGPSVALAPNLSNVSSAVLHEEIRFMDAARSLIIGFVAWGTAYIAYYHPNPSFGSAMDYIVLFIWALGLTTTGSQLIAGIRKPQTS